MLTRPILYPRAYTAYITLAALDVVLSALIILHLGGEELNAIAAWVFDNGGLPGATVFKFATVYVVLVTCELAGRYKDGELGRSLARWAVLISAVPVGVAIIELTDGLHWAFLTAATLP
ncbi:MAG: hypothetical protein AAFX05_04465 [Planctomycetota bacterium]